MSAPNNDEDTIALLKEANAAKRQTYNELREGAMRILDGLILESHKEDEALNELRESQEARELKEVLDAHEENEDKNRHWDMLSQIFTTIWEAHDDAQHKAASRRNALLQRTHSEFQRELDALYELDETVHRAWSLIKEFSDNTTEEAFVNVSSYTEAYNYQESLEEILSRIGDMTWQKKYNTKLGYNQRISQIDECYEEQERYHNVLHRILLQAVVDVDIRLDFKYSTQQDDKVEEAKNDDENEHAEDRSDEDESDENKSDEDENDENRSDEDESDGCKKRFSWVSIFGMYRNTHREVQHKESGVVVRQVPARALPYQKLSVTVSTDEDEDGGESELENEPESQSEIEKDDENATKLETTSHERARSPWRDRVTRWHEEQKKKAGRSTRAVEYDYHVDSEEKNYDDYSYDNWYDRYEKRLSYGRKNKKLFRRARY